MRAALLPTPGNPYHLAYWMRNFRTWKGEVDELHVMVTGQPNEIARNYMLGVVENEGGIYHERVDYGGALVPHGIALNILIQDCEADTVLLCEDDAFVRSPAAIGRAFTRIEQGGADVCASPRVSMTPNLEAAAILKWGEYAPLPDGADGYGMWPAFVFARRSALLATDRNYCNRSWGGGMVVAGLNYAVPHTGAQEAAVVDTFGSCAFQLRDQFTVFSHPQWKGPHLWKSWLEAGEPMSWFHVGSLSSSSDLIADFDGPGGFEFLDGRTLTSEQEIAEWASRLHWWSRFWLTRDLQLPDDFDQRYLENVERIRERMGVPWSAILAWGDVVDGMVNWVES